MRGYLDSLSDLCALRSSAAFFSLPSVVNAFSEPRAPTNPPPFHPARLSGSMVPPRR
jgi:hypothetical protein